MNSQQHNNGTPPIFIVSSERSGSNLLRTMLDNHSRLSGRRAPHLMHTFHSFAYRYQPFSNSENVIRMLRDMLRIVNCEYFEWQLETTPEKLFEKYQPSGFVECFKALYTESCVVDETESFVCKENDLFRYVFQLAAHFENAKFLYLYRDPRAYVASWLNVPFMYNTPFDAAKNWKREQEICIRIFGNYELDSHFVSYEELTMDPVSTMTQVLEYAGIPVEPECFQVQSTKNKSLEWNPFWKNLQNKVESGNREKYLQQLDESTIELIETIVKEPMQELGYQFRSPGNWKPGLLFGLRNRRQRKKQAKKLAEANQSIVERMNAKMRIIDDIKKDLPG